MEAPRQETYSNALWAAIKQGRTAEMCALQERSVGDAAVLAARLIGALWPQTKAITAEMKHDRIVWGAEYDEQPPLETSLDIEWTLRKICPCIEPGSVHLIQVSGPQRLALYTAAEEHPPPENDDLADLQCEFLRTEEQVLHDVLLNSGPLFSDSLIHVALKEARARATAGGEYTSLLFVHHLLLCRALRRAAPNTLAFALHIRYDGENSIDVVDVDRLSPSGLSVGGNPTLDGLLTDIASQVIGDGLGLRLHQAGSSDIEFIWTIMSRLSALLYPEP